MTPKRVLVKLSGEALMGDQAFGIDGRVIDRIAADLAEAKAHNGSQIALVVGGGNIFRGSAMAATGMDRTAADHMGMLATVMNGLALREALARVQVEARVLSAIPMDVVCESYARDKAVHHLKHNRIVICVAGLGSPFFTTDTAAAERAAEMECDLLMKATNVDGIYSADPRIDKQAKRYDKLTHDEAIRKGLKVMDTAAFALARENGLVISVFSIANARAITQALSGQGRQTLVVS